ncbi:hypothetical protein ABZ912_12750 [Nonomuraea angiospora]|uniref:hypothetical protein n=1 Tax=Nonomuraea angiospora TaxID=46172 RepID=UPI0033F19EA7
MPWLMFMVGVHTVWSIGVPIAVMETPGGPRRTAPSVAGRAPGPWVVFAFALVAGAFFVLL